MPFRLYLRNSKAKVSFERGEKRNIHKQHFRSLDLQKGVEIKPQKRHLLAHAAVKVEKYMAEKLFFSCIQICAPFLCQPNRFLSTYEEMAKG